MKDLDIFTKSVLMSPSRVAEPLWWTGHIPFAMWLVEATKPKTIVELGTHTGNSYFSMCHSVKSNGLSTKCYAIDTWQGDLHEGFYAEDVYHSVELHNNKNYSEFSDLVRMTFDDALQLFGDNSIDILHIDGFHTYEAVQHDFETWFPKLSDKAVVLFHDTIVKKEDFGVWRFWEELSAKYPNIHFDHSQGLGVIFVGEKQTRIICNLLRRWTTLEGKNTVKQFFRRLGNSIEFEYRINNHIQTIEELNEQITDLNQSKTERGNQITNLNQIISERDEQIIELNKSAAERDEQIYEREGRIIDLNQSIAKLDEQVVDLNEFIVERDGQIVDLNQTIAERENLILSLNDTIREIYGSRSWRITAPIRFVTISLRKMYSLFSVLPRIIKNEGLWNSFQKAIHVTRIEGFLGLKRRMRQVLVNQTPASDTVAASLSHISIIPYYIDPDLDSTPVDENSEISLAVHVYLACAEKIIELSAYLNSIPILYDLYVSLPESGEPKAIQFELSNLLTQAKNVFVESVPKRGLDIAPLIIQFGERLSQYEIIGHFHTRKNNHNNNFAFCCTNNALNLLTGPPGSSGGRVAHIVEMLQDTTSIIFPEGCSQTINDYSCGVNNDDFANHFLNPLEQLSIDDLPGVDFSGESMFWARGECLKDFLQLPLNYSDFPTESVPVDDILVQTLKRLLLLYTSKHEGQCLRIVEGDSIQDYCHYEKQRDYSSTFIHSDVKILSYYLPQFHPIPENDCWHGKGFTEWTKVKAATPLFKDHYQQHIPHPDIGYYLLDSPDMLRCQAEMMRKSGVYGQVFYHYWFSGKVILEDPAKILLDTPDIMMPFCFCWANENWTRRWDGNEDEILLEQNYSAEDARNFINYLIPFFQDPRYIKVENRPILFVYRPLSIPNPKEYLDIWAKECADHGILPPYVVSVLTRGAANPKEFGMDAGVERVLHDWTAGAVPELKNSLHFYQPFNGSVLSYDEVAKFYVGQTDEKNFTYFRSLVPFWDNTARYGSDALLLHESTPKRFQEWLEGTIAYTQSTLEPDKRFLLVNAWNEWAEGAHVEPDSRYGYSYLNSIGRALSGIPYSKGAKQDCSIPIDSKVHLSFPETVLNQLADDPDLKNRFIHSLSRSSVFEKYQISTNTMEFTEDLPSLVLSESEDADFILKFCKVSFFDSMTIEKMLKAVCDFDSAVITNSYGDDSPLLEVTSNGSVKAFSKHTVPMVLLPKKSGKSNNKNIKIRNDAHCFVAAKSQSTNNEKPLVTTVIRFHNSANFLELKNALYCLYSMRDCVVIPLIAAQDLSEQQISELEKTLSDFSWIDGCEPQVHLYRSHDGNGDLRSKMLNESLKKIKTRFAAFFDYDDLLMSHAYSWLINRLEKTGKAVAFGRVYATSKISSTGLLIERKRLYEYGYSYEEFIGHNHAPLHSFMLDLEKLDLSNVIYFEDQIYMEDYLLTMQLFTKDNCDWSSLAENLYIGDYIHCIDRTHTLAFSNDQERESVYTNPQYILCEKRISDMQKKISK